MNDSTVIILGAGASKPYGLPLGRELRDIVLKINTYPSRIELLNQFNISVEEFRNFRDDLKMSGLGTVDAFLENRPSWMKIDKVATAIALYAKENQMKLFPPHQPKDNWYEELWRSMKCSTWSALKRKNLKIISFNYDRALECYLSSVIENKFKIKRSTAAAWLSNEFITHPHGTLGEYEGEHLSDWTFSKKTEFSCVNKALKSIVVVSEASPLTAAFTRSKALLKQATKCLFMGFGFHQDNVTRLGFPELCELGSPLTAIYATHKGINNIDWLTIRRRFFPKCYTSTETTLSSLISHNI